MAIRNLLLIIFLALAAVGSATGQLFPNLGGQRAGISALTFLKLDVSPRAAAMGGACVALSGDAFALQWNPAAATDIMGKAFGVSNTFWVAGIQHSYFGGIWNISSNAGTVGIQAQALNAGQMERRTETNPMGTGEMFSAYNVALGLSYAKSLTDRFSFGLNLKYVNETLDQYVAHTGVVDLGFLYRVDWKDLKFAVMLQSFGPNSKLRGDQVLRFNGQPVELESYPSPTVFSLGISMMPIRTDRHALTTALQLNHPNDNAENIRIGVEYSYRNFLFARGGYKINVEDQPLPTFGVGIRARLGRHPLHIDYAVDPMPYLGWRQRVGLSLNLVPAASVQRTDTPADAAAAPDAPAETPARQSRRRRAQQPTPPTAE